MKKHPEFFSLSDEEKDIFKIENNDSLDDSFSIFVYNYLNKTNLSLDELDLFKFSNETLYNFNKETCVLRGIGENYFYINENFAEVNSILNFETLYDYDFANHNFQESINNEKENIIPYKMRLTGYFSRAYISNQFHYISLMSPSIYIYDKIDESLFDLINELIPYSIVSKSKKNQKSSFSFKYDAKGKEYILNELKKHSRTLLSSLYEELIDFFDKNPMSCIWEIKDSEYLNPHITYIFSDKNLLKKIRFKTFEKDVLEFKTDDISFLEFIFREKNKELSNKIREKHSELIMSYDQKISLFDF